MNHRYTHTAIFLHWVIALGLIGTFALGFYMEGLPLTPTKLKLYSWHKWAGISLLAFVVIRLAWRLTHPAPAFPETMSARDQWLANAGHWLLYVLMLAIPLSGWMMSSAQGFPVVWFGVLPLPDLVPKSETLGEVFRIIHVILNYLMLVTVIGHVGAAMQHHFIKKDTVLIRMLPLPGKRKA